MAKVTTAERELFQRLECLSGWDVAKHYGCEYDGDANPVVHGGFFYSLRDWERYGYAPVVEFWEDPETGHLVVQPGVVHRSSDMERAFRCCDIQGAERDIPQAQVVACRYYVGIEPNGYGFPALKSFDLEAWKEWRIWRSIHPWLEELRS